MIVKTYTPSIAEVLKKVNNAKTKDKKIAVLKENDNESLRMVIKSFLTQKLNGYYQRVQFLINPMKYQKVLNILYLLKRQKDCGILLRVQIIKHLE